MDKCCIDAIEMHIKTSEKDQNFCYEENIGKNVLYMK